MQRRAVLSAAVLVLVALPASAQQPGIDRREVTLTCDRDAIDPESYELTTTAQAINLREPRYAFWDRFIINEHVRTLRDLNLDAPGLAERARERDPRNLMAHSILGRQYLTLDWQRAAREAWRLVLGSGGALVYTATLYDVDAKSYFLVAFDREEMRIYRAGQFSGTVERHLGMAEFPEPDATAFYAAWAGCPDPAVVPAATIPWSQVKEIRSGNWVLWFKLTDKVTVVSDRNKRKSLGEIKVNLHGQTGHTELYVSPDFDGDLNVRGVGLGPYDYQRSLRDIISEFADPYGRITLSASGRGAGW
jgi:hypothetical protein